MKNQSGKSNLATNVFSFMIFYLVFTFSPFAFLTADAVSHNANYISRIPATTVLIQDNGTDNDTGIVTTENETEVSSDPVVFTTELLLIGGGLITLSFVIGIVTIIYFRRKEITETDWEDDDDWINEDWVDIDIDDNPNEVSTNRIG